MTKVCFVKCSPKYREASSLHDCYQHSVLSGEEKRRAESHILRNGTLSLSFLHFICLSPFFLIEFQVHVLKCGLWGTHVRILSLIVETKRHSHRPMFPSQLILLDQESTVGWYSPIPLCGLSRWHMTFTIFPTCELHRMLGVEQEFHHGKKKKKF